MYICSFLIFQFKLHYLCKGLRNAEEDPKLEYQSVYSAEIISIPGQPFVQNGDPE